MTGDSAEIGIIGGTGIYDSGLLQDGREVEVPTPYGRPSDAITLGEFKGRRMAFLPRHGKKHAIAPHMINFRANIWALKELGVKRVIAPSAVGSLREEVKPAHFVLPDQFIDFTKSRIGSFAEEGRVIHISMADPFCPELRECVLDAAGGHDVTVHGHGTYICIEGPRFSTKAESGFYRTLGADIIGMTLVPECQLAREARMCYTTIATVTDYDVWAERPVTAKEVLRTVSENAEKTGELLTALTDRIPTTRGCSCEKALAEAEF